MALRGFVMRRRLARRRHLSGIAALALAAVGMAVFGAAPAAAAPGEVLMLDSTLSGGASSTLAQKFVLAGKTPVVVNGATWASMTAAQFDAYDAIVLGDPTCSSSVTTSAGPAEANALVWSSVVNGNVLIIGSDETYHQSQGGAALMEKAAAFTVAKPGTTGAYISLSCYYHGTAPMTPVPLLAGFGTFTATGVGCYNDAHIVATHPALAGLTDATLSNWSCSVHEAFDSWPVSFEVLAIARGIGTSYTATDGSVGTPYILARGVEVISDIKLAPETATNPVGTSHTVTATVTKNDPSPGTPVVGKTVTFTVIAGPHTGTTGTGVTNGSGQATFSYTGTLEGTDTIEATFVDDAGRTQRSNRVTKTWEKRVGNTCGTVSGNGVPRENPKAKFSFSVRYITGQPAPTGSVFFNDKAAKVRFDSTSITSLVITGDTAEVTGNGTANGVPVTFILKLNDKPDTFDITLSNGYHATWTPKTGKINFRHSC
jgi:hypothetical protein